MNKMTPDFDVSWSDASLEFDSQIYCQQPDNNNDALLQEKMKAPLLLLDTPIACVAVSEISWNEPTSISLLPDRPAFCLTVSMSSGSGIKYGFEDDLNLSAEQGNLLFLVPGKKLTGQGGRGCFRTIMCSFDAGFAQSIIGSLNDLTNEQLVRSLNIQNSLITSILFRLMKETLHPGSRSEVLVESCIRTMLIEYVDWINRDSSVKSDNGRLSHSHLALIDEYLNGVAGKLPSVAELAKLCRFSERQFLKVFREHNNCSVSEYIRSFQISKAKTYLLDTDLPIKEIAYRLGFSSSANFTTAFRTATGKTPGQLRRQR